MIGEKIRRFLMAEIIHTLGDSTIDNLFWMLKNTDLETAKSRTVEGLLRGKGHTVESHAYDGFTTDSVLKGDRIGSVLPNWPEKIPYMKEKAPDQTFIEPLKELQQKISEKPEDTHYVVISVGGNDFRVNLANPWRLIRDIPQIQKRHLEIVERVKNLEGRNIKPILMLQYRTDANNDPYLIYTVFGVIGTIAIATHLTCIAVLTSPLWILTGQVSALAGGVTTLAGAIGLYGSRKIIPLSVTKNVLCGQKIGMTVIGELIQSFYQPILKQAKEDCIPVLDLTNTFNPYAPLYDCGIEPNEKGAKRIADGIDHILRNHNFSGESRLYAKRSGCVYKGVPNPDPSKWRVTYPIKAA